MVIPKMSPHVSRAKIADVVRIESRWERNTNYLSSNSIDADPTYRNLIRSDRERVLSRQGRRGRIGRLSNNPIVDLR